MSLIGALSTRLGRQVARLISVVVQRIGVGPVVLAAAAAAAALVHLFRRRSNTAALASTSDVSSRHGRAGRLSTRSSPNDRAPQWLKRVRTVSIGATCADSPNALFVPCDDLPNGDEHANAVRLADGVAPHLARFVARFNVFLVVRVDHDHAETAVMNALRHEGLFDPGLLDPRKVLFCETDLGRVSIARQLEPQLHIDPCFDVIVGLQRFVVYVAWIASDLKSHPTDQLARNVFRFATFSSCFAPPPTNNQRTD